jgi:hypothetical protein
MFQQMARKGRRGPVELETVAKLKAVWMGWLRASTRIVPGRPRPN